VRASVSVRLSAGVRCTLTVINQYNLAV